MTLFICNMCSKGISDNINRVGDDCQAGCGGHYFNPLFRIAELESLNHLQSVLIDKLQAANTALEAEVARLRDVAMLQSSG